MIATPKPDTRDWTFVIDSGCTECGWQPHPPARIVDGLQQAAPRWQAVLARGDASKRPSPEVWSPVEYACHVRDMIRLLGERTASMLAVYNPPLTDWDGEAVAVRRNYHSRRPAEVSEDLVRCTKATVDVMRTVLGKQWDRPGRRSDGTDFTIGSLTQYISHEVHHHLYDVNG